MDFQLSEEQALLCESARRYVVQTYGYEARCKAVASGEAFAAARWSQMTELGWLALAVPEAHGGLGGSAVDFALLVEQLGAGLPLEPLVPVIAATRLLVAAGTNPELVGDVMAGSARPVIAHGEAHVAATAERSGAGWLLSGAMPLVLGGAAATHYVIAASCPAAAEGAQAVSLFLVAADHPGLGRKDLRLTDDSLASVLDFTGLELPADALIGADGGGLAAWREGLAWQQLGLHAEALGAMDKALWTTRDYVRTRRQFGTELATFQAVQHRLADMVMEVELARSILLRLLSVFDEAGAERDRILAAAKVQFGKAGFFVGAQAVQLHGGMGMTDEYLIGMVFKRLVLLRNLHGGPGAALERLALDQRALERLARDQRQLVKEGL
ncbi:MAG: acyl-CoA dehydrogenase [Sphingomonadales bacterium]|nr:acyl-CoA dehydrogenase [Sphingomonadales bacterium]MBU3991206.1 acyl-CoA dehydrogenase [Alphaproteobacteria bacterium]